MTKCKSNVKTLNDVLNNCLECKVDKVEGTNTCQVGKDILNKAIEDGKNFKPKEIPRRTQNSLITELKKGNFVACPNDKILIIHIPNLISSSIHLILVNKEREEHIDFSVDNKMASWRWLKKFNEITGREVIYKKPDVEIPFKDSVPYQHRFTA